MNIPAFTGIPMPRKTKTSAADALGAQIGGAIKSARANAGLTQLELAERLGIEVPTLSRIENGAQMPSIERLNAIADALNVTLGSLLPGDSASDAWEHGATEAMRKVPRSDRQFVMDFILNYVAHSKAKRKKPTK